MNRLDINVVHSIKSEKLNISKASFPILLNIYVCRFCIKLYSYQISFLDMNSYNT